MAITEEIRQSELYREIKAETAQETETRMRERTKEEQALKVRNYRMADSANGTAHRSAASWSYISGMDMDLMNDVI